MAFLPRSKCLLISWFQSPSTVILEPKKMKSVTASTFSPSICHEMMGPDAMILVFLMLSFKSDFQLSSFTFIKKFKIKSLLCLKVCTSYQSTQEWCPARCTDDLVHPERAASSCPTWLPSTTPGCRNPWNVVLARLTRGLCRAGVI